MADIVTPRDLSNELVSITNDATLFEIYNPDQSRNEKVQMSTLLSYVAASDLATLTVLGETILARDGGSVSIGTSSAIEKMELRAESGIDVKFAITKTDDTPGQNQVLIAHVDNAGGVIDIFDDAGANTVKIRSYSTGNVQAYFDAGNVGVRTTLPGQIFDVNQGSGNMIADGYDNHSLAEYKEGIKDITVDYLKNLADCPPKIWKRKPHIPAVDIRYAAIKEFGGATWLEYFPKDNYRNGAIKDMPDSSMKTWIDTWCENKRIEMRQRPEWQRDFVGLVADDEVLQEKLPEVIAMDDNGVTSGISLNDYIGVLHAAIIQLNDRIEQLE